MSVFRPSNINKRLVGTATTATGGSPGNGGVIGKEIKPYCFKKDPVLGQQYYCGGACGGIFRSKESYCGSKECCRCTASDFGGNLICKAAGTYWIAAPAAAGASGTWYSRGAAVTCAQNCTGCTGWFVPSCGQLVNPGVCCRTYWGNPSGIYWSNDSRSPYQGFGIFMVAGGCYNPGNKTYPAPIRAFRTVSY